MRVEELIASAEVARAAGELERAAALLDRAARLDRERALPLLSVTLDELAVTELGLRFRYIPAGSFVMGARDGDEDEKPPHEVILPAFWMTDAPLSWCDLARVLGLPDPPTNPSPDQTDWLGRAMGPEPGYPDTPLSRAMRYAMGARIRLQYCENETLRAGGWHRHDPASRWVSNGKEVTSQELFGRPPRASEGPYRYDLKPAVAVEWSLADFVARHASTAQVTYALPTEAEWERAARGCFVDAPFPWGHAPTDPERADFDRMSALHILPSRRFAPNDFGLYAMAGSVWEWCADAYDASFYAESPPHAPFRDVPPVSRPERVLRGGSWTDCPEALRVSFRSSSSHGSSPNIGFRLIRRRPA